MKRSFILYLFALFAGTISHKYSSRPANCTFSAWPHRKVFNGVTGEGLWISRQTPSFWKANNVEFSPEVGIVQYHALSEGVFLPASGTNFRIFSSDEVKKCFQGKTVYVIGDSYMKNAFIGLADIILERPSNEEMRSATPRARVYESVTTDVRLTNRGKFVVEYILDDCRQRDLDCFMASLNSLFDGTKKVDAVIMNVLVHHLRILELRNLTNESDELYIRAVRKLLEKHGRYLTWASGPAYDLDKIPKNYREAMGRRQTDRLNHRTMEIARELGVPVMDYFSMTGYCRWDNCSSDGGHRSRFVNRMKAQMWLNNLCKCH